MVLSTILKNSTVRSQSRILCAAPGFNAVGGMETYMLNLVHALKEAGWVTGCLATNFRGDRFDVLSRSHRFFDLSKKTLSIAKVIEAAAVVNEYAPDILLLSHASLLHYALPLLERSIKPVAVVHSDDPRFYRVAASFGHRIFRWIAPSQGVAAGLSGRLPAKDRDRIRVIPHGVSRTNFHARSRSVNSIGNIAFVGHIAENKGADLLPSILASVLERSPGVHLHIVGYGPLKEQLSDEFARRDLDSHVTFVNVLAPDQLGVLLRETDILLLPTRIEGFGLAIVEAMLCGVVPVVSGLPGITDGIVQSGRTGFLPQPDNVRGFADAIVKLTLDGELLRDMSAAVVSHAEDCFSAEIMLARYQALFAEEDDRASFPRRGRLSWMKETLQAITKRDGDGRPPSDVVINHIKRSLGMMKNGR